MLPVGVQRERGTSSPPRCAPPSLAGQGAGARLTNEQAQVAGVLQLVRAPVEPVMRELKLHSMFAEGRKFRHGYSQLQMWYKTMIHMRARDMYIKHDRGQQRRRLHGPYRHFD